MSKAKLNLRRPFAVLLASVGCTALVLPLVAADGTPPVRPPSTMVNLIQRLAERGALNADDAAELTKLAEADAADARVQAALATLAAAQADAAQARAEAAAAQLAALKKTQGQTQVVATPVPAPAVSVVAPAAVVPTPSTKLAETAKTAPAVVDTAGVGVDSASAPVTRPAATPTAPEEDTVHVTYVPEVVKAQLREEIKNDVMQQAKDEHWAAPRSFPDWVSRFTLYGDFRMRYEGIYNHQSNEVSNNAINFNALNTGAPFDFGTTNLVNLPRYNVDQNRNRVRLRARLGAAIDLGEGFTANMRFATGENNSPVSQNQTLGSVGSGQGGNFSKYAVWLDRAYLKYQSSSDLSRALTATLGRFENPFLSTSVLWADDLGFDGAVMTIPVQVHLGGDIKDSIKPYFVAGAFPVFNTDLNFPTNSKPVNAGPSKFQSNDKWLEAVQLGLDLKLGQDFKGKLGAAYYYFTKTAGKLSTPYIPLTSSDAGDTDGRRPAFAQSGNTYMALRKITPDATLNGSGTTNQWQYFGLVTPFRDVAVDAKLDYNHFEPFQISLLGEYIKNMGFDRNKVLARNPENNMGASASEFLGGDTAWIVGLKLGASVLEKRWDWNVGINYRYVESDAVIDGFCDSDFGGGGTNVKGPSFGANVALTKRVSLGARWMSATQIVAQGSTAADGTPLRGTALKNDILQIDLNAKF